jgi:hypothetical protein
MIATPAAHLWRLSPWAIGTSTENPPAGRAPVVLDEALALYGELDTLITEALAAPPAERLRLAARLVNRCDALDAALARAGVAPRGNLRRRDGAGSLVVSSR